MKISTIVNPLATAILSLGKSPKIIPKNKKDWYPDIDDNDGIYIDIRTGEIKEIDKEKS